MVSLKEKIMGSGKKRVKLWSLDVEHHMMIPLKEVTLQGGQTIEEYIENELPSGIYTAKEIKPNGKLGKTLISQQVMINVDEVNPITTQSRLVSLLGALNKGEENDWEEKILESRLKADKLAAIMGHDQSQFTVKDMVALMGDMYARQQEMFVQMLTLGMQMGQKGDLQAALEALPQVIGSVGDKVVSPIRDAVAMRKKREAEIDQQYLQNRSQQKQPQEKKALPPGQTDVYVALFNDIPKWVEKAVDPVSYLDALTVYSPQILEILAAETPETLLAKFEKYQGLTHYEERMAILRKNSEWLRILFENLKAAAEPETSEDIQISEEKKEEDVDGGAKFK